MILAKINCDLQIWLDKKMVAGDAVKPFVEPLYGPYYLPRKFKIAVAVPPHNDTDVYCQYVCVILNRKSISLRSFK